MTQGNWPGPQGHPQWNRPGQGWNQPQRWQNQQAPAQWGQPWRAPGPQQGFQQQGYKQPPGFQQGFQPGYPPPQWRPPKKRSGFGGVLFVIFAVVVCLVIGAQVYRAVTEPESVRTERPSEPVVTPSEESSPEPLDPDEVSGEPTTVQPEGLPERQWDALPPPDSTDPDWMTLQQSPLYAMEVPVIDGCPDLELAANLTDLERIATAQMDCLQAAYRPILDELGYDSSEIPIYFYEGRSVDTPCGEVAAPALYCSAQGGAIYFGEDALNGASWVDFGTKDVAGHEYGHHLQAKAGLFHAEYAVGADNETARRIELQATCWGYASLSHDTSVDIDERKFEEFEPFLRALIEDGIHGSKDSNAYWGIRGLYSGTLGNCNTWTAASADVD